ncbi:MAG TPA: thioredoxin-like domain-containing protein [Ktedonobacterales bacterium]|jgi:thiol-disulfide isomerase/thioredoxin/sugar lactone lactonase YvrE
MATVEREPVRAPELSGAAWFNTDHPLTLADLKGKLVLLDFWTYCCINCMHILPDLKYLEEKYAHEPLVVIGVHSAKFENEKDTDNIRNAILRYGISHPVVVDVNHRLWNAYAVRGWPTVVLVDPAGYLLGTVSGEGHREQLDMVIAAALDAYKGAGLLDDTPLPVHLESDALVDMPLAYPGKIVADQTAVGAGARLFISDSGHHRVVIATSEGTLLDTIGTGAAGADDGSFEEASFSNPQGLALDAEHDWLYVADTDNHLLRRLDLKARTVKTVAGTGEQGIGPNLSAPALEQPLNSPWDLCFVDGLLYIAMAGCHMLWLYDPASEELRHVAGSGREARIDGPALRSAFAQPSGLTTDGRALYVADSEISSVRRVTLGDDVQVTTVAGGDLFQFGDVDGLGDLARFQHPLGVAWHDGAIYVADTYNHKIRKVDPETRRATSFLGDGKPGADDGEQPRFYEPGGLSFAGERLFIADTNNHAIRVVDLASKTVSTLTIGELCPPGFCLPEPGFAGNKAVEEE